MSSKGFGPAKYQNATERNPSSRYTQVKNMHWEISRFLYFIFSPQSVAKTIKTRKMVGRIVRDKLMKYTIRNQNDIFSLSPINIFNGVKQGIISK